MVLKKGQVSIFIIIGIILVIALGIGIYIYQTKVVKPIEEVIIPVMEKAPAEVLPIQEYVTSCVQGTAKVALRRLGDYGGYLDNSKFAYNPIEPTEGEAVQFSPGSSLIIPYWWFLKSKNECIGTCEFSSLRPYLYKSEGTPSIEAQLNEYVSEHLKDCLAGLDAFREQGFEFEEQEQAQVETTIGKDKVVFLVRYPLRITKADQTFYLKEYVSALDLALGDIYDLATEIVNTQGESRILEGFTREMIADFSSLDKGGIPPMYEIDVKFGAGTVWTKFEVAKRLQEIITSYVPMLQVGNTRFYRFLYAPDKTVSGDEVRDNKLFEALYNRGLLFTVSNKTRESLGVHFTYLPWWPVYFDLNCNGQACTSESISNTYLYVFGFQKYAFAYDVSYPVLVEIRDPFAFNREGYSFKFFIESNLRNNFPMPPVFKPLEAQRITTTSMLCDEMQKTSGEITITVNDARTKRGADEAYVGYTCGSESCAVGVTANGTLNAKLPRCLGGVLSAAKEGYQTGLMKFDVIDDNPHTALLEIEPYRYVNINAKKWVLRKGVGWDLDTSEAKHQDPDDDTTIILERKTGPMETDFTVFAEICGRGESKSAAACGSPPEDMSENIRILPGEYKVNIYSFKYPRPGFKIPPDKRSIPLPFGRKTYMVPQEDIVFDEQNPWPSGFAEFEINISAEKLSAADTIEFYYISVALDKVPEKLRKIEDLEQMGKTMEYSTQYRSLLEPEYLRVR